MQNILLKQQGGLPKNEMFFISQPEICCACMHFIELKMILEAKSCSNKQGLKLDALKA